METPFSMLAKSTVSGAPHRLDPPGTTCGTLDKAVPTFDPKFLNGGIIKQSSWSCPGLYIMGCTCKAVREEAGT